MPMRAVAATGCNKHQVTALNSFSISHGSHWLVCNSDKRIPVITPTQDLDTPKIILLFSSEVTCCCTHAIYSNTVMFCLMDGRVLSLSLDLILNDLNRNSATDVCKGCGAKEGSLLTSAPSTQESYPCIFAEPYCTTIACYDNSGFTVNRIMMCENIMLLQLRCKDDSHPSIINGYTSLLDPTRYSKSFTVRKDAVISSFIVLYRSCGEASSDSATVSIIDHLVVSYCGPDVALSKSSILLYGTCNKNGDSFYTVIPSTGHCFKEPNLKSYKLLSLNQPVVEILEFSILCSNDTKVGAISLFFIGKEGKICVLFSSGRVSGCKEFLLNVPVYSACFLNHYLLISSYKEILVINLQYKGSDKDFCASTLLVEAFCNPSILNINSVVRMYINTARSAILLVKRNGYVYILDETDLRSKLSSPIRNNLQEVVTQICEISDKVCLLKNNVNATEMSLKLVNSAISIFLNLNHRDKNLTSFNRQLLPDMHIIQTSEGSMKLDLKISGTKLSTDGWFLSVQVVSPNFTSFYFLSNFGQVDESLTKSLKLPANNLPCQVTCIVYCDFTHVEYFSVNMKEVVGISTVLKRERFNVLDFLKECNSPSSVQYPLSNKEGYLTLNKQSLERLKDHSRAKVLIDKLLHEVDSETANFHRVSLVICKANIVNTVHVHRIIKDDCVIVRLLTNSAAFVCELRAAVVQKLQYLQPEISSSAPVSCDLQMRSQLQSISSQLQRIGDQLITLELDRVNCAKQLFVVYQQFCKL